MRKVILHMMSTLDGCVSGPQGELDWLFAINDKETDNYVFNLYTNMDGILVGRRTYLECANYWPKAAIDESGQPQDRAFARLMNATPKYVFSQTLKNVEWSNSSLVKGEIAQEVTKLKQQPGKNLVLIGGFSTAQTFLKQGLIDEFHLIVHPVVLGKGKRLFAVEGLNNRLNLKLIKSMTFRSGVIALYYQTSNQGVNK